MHYFVNNEITPVKKDNHSSQIKFSTTKSPKNFQVMFDDMFKSHEIN
jgi:hypothetical protein